MPAARRFTAASRLDDLVLVSTGPESDGLSWIDVRIYDPSGAEVARAPLPAGAPLQLDPILAAISRPDGGAVAIAFYEQGADGIVNPGFMVADCAEPL